MEKMIADKAISGTFGEVWIDGEKFAEATGLQAKIDILKEDIPICGAKNGKGKKQMGWEGKGSVELTKVNSRLLQKQVAALQAGKSLVCTIVSKLADPASSGAERISLKNVTFDDISLADWSANKIITEQKPFTFDDFELIDTIS